MTTDNKPQSYQDLLSSSLMDIANIAVSLAQDYVEVITDTQKRLDALSAREDEVFSLLGDRPLNPSDGPFYHPTRYSSTIELTKSLRNICLSLIDEVATLIRDELQIPFRPQGKIKMAKSFMNNGLDITLLYHELERFLGGRTPADYMKDLSVHKLYKIIFESRINLDNDELPMMVDENVVVLQGFVDKDYWGVNGTPGQRGERDIACLSNYFKDYLKESILPNNEQLVCHYRSPDSPPIPLASIHPSIESISLYTSGDIAIVFHDTESAQAFANPILTYGTQLPLLS